MAIYKLSPVFKEMIWGGSKLKTDFDFSFSSNQIGEAWVISAHQNGDCLFSTGEYTGQSLSQVYAQHRHLFGYGDNKKFPLLVKIIDANQNLSIQVHPDDEYALIHDQSYGKTECWYILDCPSKTPMIIDHHAPNHQALVDAAYNGTIMDQLNITYEVKEARSFLRARATAIVLSLLFGLLVIGAFSLIVLGGVIQDWIGNRFGFSDALLIFFVVFRWIMIVLALLLGFSMIYRYAPNVEQKFMFITPGSVLGVTLLIIVSLGFAFYTSNFGDYSATYGSIGAVIILMLWLYIAGLVILIGSEINVLVEHYSPKGKQKGEKKEGQRRGGKLAKRSR